MKVVYVRELGGDSYFYSSMSRFRFKDSNGQNIGPVIGCWDMQMNSKLAAALGFKVGRGKVGKFGVKKIDMKKKPRRKY